MPPPPNYLTIARAEIRPYGDSSENLITPHKESTVHYHCHIWCIKAVEPLFDPLSLGIPMDINLPSHTLGVFARNILVVASMYECSPCKHACVCYQFIWLILSMYCSILFHSILFHSVPFHFIPYSVFYSLS